MSLETFAQILAVLLSILVAGRVGFVLSRDALMEGRSVATREIEAWLPLKGRWLRLLALAPAHLFLSGVVFAGSLLVFMLLLSIVSALLRNMCRLLGVA
jgi:hypothetical protein